MAQINDIDDNYVKLMLDSGVFSAWNRNEEISLEEYIDYLKDNSDLLFSYVNMDVIPGKFGRKRTMQEVADSAKGSYDNWQFMRKQGLDPIPVFHQGEKFEWLEKMIADGETYIGISSAKDVPVKEQRRWLDEVFTMLTTKEGIPAVKTHGFGIMAVSLILRYPFFTCDSTSWALGGGYGKILVPNYKNGEPDYTKRPNSVILSDKLQSSSSAQKMQFDQFGKEQQEAVFKFLKEVAEVDFTEARYDPSTRHKCWFIYYQELCNHLVGLRFNYRQNTMVPNHSWEAENPDPDYPWKLRMMFATNTGATFSHLMNGVGVTNRLLNYYELRDKTDDLLEKYVKQGYWKPLRNKPQKANWKNERYRNKRYMKLAKRIENANGT